MARLDRAISFNTMNRVMARSKTAFGHPPVTIHLIIVALLQQWMKFDGQRSRWHARRKSRGLARALSGDVPGGLNGRNPAAYIDARFRRPRRCHAAIFGGCPIANTELDSLTGAAW